MSSFRSSFWDRSGSQSGSQSRSQPGSQPGSQLDSQSGSQPGSQPVGGGGWGRSQGSPSPSQSQPARGGGGWGRSSQGSPSPSQSQPAGGSRQPHPAFVSAIFTVIMSWLNSIGIRVPSEQIQQSATDYATANPPQGTRRLFEQHHVEAALAAFQEGFQPPAPSPSPPPTSQPRRNQTDGYQPQRNDPNNFFGRILSRIKAFQYVLPQTAVDFTQDYTREHGNKEHGEFTSKDVDAAIEAFKEQVDPYHILGFREGSVPFESLPSDVRAKICIALKMNTAGPSGLSGVHAIPNFYLFIAGKEGTPGERTLDDWSQNGYYKAPLMIYTWNSDLNQFMLLNRKKRCYHDDLVLVMPKCIGRPIRTTESECPIIRNGGYSHFLTDAIPGLRTFGDVYVEKHYGPGSIAQIQAKMSEPLSSWCDPMEAMGAIKLCVHFQQEASTSASASADPSGEEDSTSSNPWGAAAPSASSNPWGAAAP